MKRLALKDMQRAARSRGGRCLSSVYVNSYTPLQWQCARGHRWRNSQTKVGWECGSGHRWFAIPNSVKRGSWCPECWLSARS
jgi:hypothetical protein